MNQLIRDFEKTSGIEVYGLGLDRSKWQYCLEQFANLIVEEHINVLRSEWYTLNNTPAPENETARELGIRLGRKSEIIVLIEKIKSHFYSKDN